MSGFTEWSTSAESFNQTARTFESTLDILVESFCPMRKQDTYGKGELLRMDFSYSTLKGMKRVLEERNVDVRKMKAEDMRQVLRSMLDLKGPIAR